MICQYQIYLKRIINTFEALAVLMGGFELNNAQICFKYELKVSVFKSLRTVQLSYLEEQKSIPY